ncbi:MAG: SpoIIE family protein phosphatase [Candidatus Aminicenantes bacterium]|nr:SpoIIE family protein phosphatase [Candidatus Aminicenantes bacterium]
MKKLKLSRQSLKKILGAVIGLMLTAVFFFLIAKSPLIVFLRPTATKQEILANAASFCRSLPADIDRFKQKVFIYIDRDLLRYAQYYRKENGKFPDLNPGYWHIAWYDKNDRKTSHESAFYVRYNFKGDLIEFRKREKDLESEKRQNFEEDDALVEAIYFLQSLNIETKSLVIADKEINEKSKQIKYRFTLKNKLRKYPALIEKYTVEILGSRIGFFKMEQIVDYQVIGDLGKDYSKRVTDILLILTWLTLCFILIAQFIKKLRKDELEFKRAFWIGSAIALMLFLLIVLKERGPDWQALIGGVASGLAVLVGMLIVFPTTESQCREAWSDKLGLIDLLSRGKVWIRDLGAAILDAFFLVGVTLLFFGGIFLLVAAGGPGYIELKESLPGVFQDFSWILMIVIRNLIITLFVGLTVLCFWPGYLRNRFTQQIVWILLVTLTFLFAGLHTIFSRPAYLSILLATPIAAIWAIIVLKFNLLTVLFSLFGINFFLDMVLVTLLPDSFLQFPGMSVIITAGFILVLGIYLIFRPRSAGDYEDYVPEYVNRIAEKERILKELEIARSVQMRFLPKKAPEFPNLEMVSLCQPAMEVGGDYYDFIQLDDRCMSILIGDVSGKGVSAAFYMTMIKGIIKTLARKIKEPALLLAEANEIFYENAPRNTFITVIYGIFDLQSKKLTIACAGHNPLIAWKQREKKTRLYNPAGIALGLKQGEAYRASIKEESIEIESGDIFVFYTDGVTEAMNMKHEIFGERRLLGIIEKYSGFPPRQIEERIIEAVREFSGDEPQHDDFTMVIVKIK